MEVNNIEEIVRKYDNESDILKYVKPILKELLLSPGAIPKEVFYPRKDRFANNLIYMPADLRHFQFLERYGCLINRHLFMTI